VTLESVPVHPWTRAWWGTLPAAYKAADAVQEAPGLLYQVGFNGDPTFGNGLDGWDVEPVEQTNDYITLKFSRVFFGADFTKAVVFQAWWTADAPGASLILELTDAAGVQLGRFDDAGLPEGDGDYTLTALMEATDPITATLTFGSPIDDGGLLFNIRGVNVGQRAVTFEGLPGNAFSANYPLMRYMEGIGQIAGQLRDVSDGLWDGEFLDPRNTPDAALRWVAQLMGISETIRNQPAADLRDHLIDLADNGRPASGTRGEIGNAARRYLTGTKQVAVVPSPTVPHRLVLLVSADELPGADVNLGDALGNLVGQVRKTGVVPAGHELKAQIATPTWDQWEAAAGATWTTRQNAARTWTEADSLGVTLTE